ncbi:HD family hydrolase [Chenggangzhangella methanolivorans]|uniref:HD family hydrolase n=1 Tax=Chenggangzhangella methanolivorans TaxID=1437009 RepID=A0A9E6ULT7_9HYPH|nr:HD family hydrolase [Chenggangzhangella methanolivorans]QZO00917.1 HD family hydrolase [Chenggangzhangella methanolivorans]
MPDRPPTTPIRAPKRAAGPRAWQRMLSGRRLDLLAPSPLDVEIEDVAHGLARVARWNGQTTGEHIFSVAQHSLLVEQIARRIEPAAPRASLLWALLHDGPEYVVGDMISPFKAVIGDSYREVEARLAAAVRLRFGLSPEPDAACLKLVKRADQSAAFLEATRLAGFSLAEATTVFGRPVGAPHDADLTPWPAETAKRRFLDRFAELAV